MDRREAIRIRRSVRSYDGRETNETDVSALLNEMGSYNKESNMTMEWVRDGSEAFRGLTRSYGMFRGVKSLISIKGMKGDPDLKEKAGYYGELLALDAVIAGFGTCFVGGTYDRTKMNVPDDEDLILVITVGYPADKETLRQRIIKKAMHKDTSVSKYLETDREPPAWVTEGIDAALKAPSAMNRKPVRFRFKGGELTAYVEKDDGYSMTDLGAAKANFETVSKGRFELGNNAKFVRSD